ncbi:MAG TPA: DUF2520 domain-containing protein [Albitalea sp.]|uniref:Rossmann-like and DUF2520 domain-containing protein n=1 Tax=Piscinibacter sp. TaxID=1903157 RepID=UPI002ED09B18
MTSIAFIGAGRLGSALARALARRGVDVTAVASRGRASADALAVTLPGCQSLPIDEAARAELVFLTVPDDDIGPLAARIAWSAGQQVVHCSGATDIAVLEPAARAGALVGGFHPLQIFSDPVRAVDLIAGSTVTIEAGAPVLEARLRELADVLDMRVLRLPAGARALYHGGASFAASLLLSMLREALQAWGAIGIAEEDALQALLPLAHGTLAAAAQKGLAGALSGPVSRGDMGVVQRHLRAMEALGPSHVALYRQLSVGQVELARESGRLNHERLAAMQRLIDGG